MKVLYYSTKRGEFIDIDEMHVKHIMNAIVRIEKGTHERYTTYSKMYVQLMKKLIQYLDAGGNALLKKVSTQRTAVKLAQDALTVSLKIDSLNRGRILDLQHENRYLRAKLAELKAPQPKTITMEGLRYLAVKLIRRDGITSADNLRAEVKELGYEVPGHMYCHVFRDKRFKQELYGRSTWKKANGRYIKHWGLTGT